MRISRLWLVCAAAVAAACMSVQAGSIWEKAGGQNKKPYTDDIARNVGDILSIVINENPNIQDDGSRTLEKKNTHTADASGSMQINKGHIEDHPFWFPFKFDWTFPDLTLDARADNKIESTNKGKLNRTLTDQITVTVEDVLPNGNLIVMGKIEREWLGDKQLITASGIVRPSDITYANTVRSSQVADFHLLYVDRGQGNLYMQPGWLVRLLNWLNPF